MFKKLKAVDLCLELTRRCNMKCCHCLRGEPQNIDMTKEIINRVFEKPLTDVDCIIFTGGEPSLVYPLIDYIREKIQKNNIFCSSFYMATNGKENALPTSVELLKLYADICDINGYDPVTISLEDFSTVTISFDDYHEKISTHNENIYKSLRFYHKDKDSRDAKYPGNVIRTGRAINLEKAILRDPVPVDEPVIEVFADYMLVSDILYISANGNVNFGCDFSYDYFDAHAIGNVLSEPLVEIMTRTYESYRDESD